jgi:tight adherence protein C
MNDWVEWLNTPGTRNTLLLAGIVFLGSLMLLVPLLADRGRSRRRLEPNPEQSASNLLGPAFAEPEPRSRLAQDLLRAGYYHPNAVAQFNSLRFVLILIPLVVAGAIAYMANPAFITRIGMLGIVGAALGFSLPRIYLNIQGRNRVRAIEKALPTFADLMSLALLSGQNILGALTRVRSEMRFSHPIFADELDLIARQAELNNFTTAIEQFADRVDMPDVSNLSVILNQSQQLGTDIATALMEFATVLRTTLRHRAEAQAQRAGFWLLFPSIFCMWGPAALILLAPAFFEFQERRQKNRELILEGKKDYEERFGPYMKNLSSPKSAPSSNGGPATPAP